MPLPVFTSLKCKLTFKKKKSELTPYILHYLDSNPFVKNISILILEKGSWLEGTVYGPSCTPFETAWQMPQLISVHHSAKTNFWEGHL